MTHHKPKPYFKLQLIVIIAAFTAVLGELISLPAYSLVIWRTGMAAILLGLWLRSRLITFPYKLISIFSGLILGAHWMAFFGAVNLANISICLTGVASGSLFTAASEAIQEKRRPHLREVFIGLMIIPGIILIAGVESGHISGLLCGILAAIMGSIFPVINKSVVRKGADALGITFYNMLGAVFACAFFALVIRADFSNFIPTGLDLFWLGILTTVCTVFAFALYVNLLKYFSAYETNLAFNFEPVYGIILAALIFAEHEKLHPLFFLGAGTIIIANILNPILARRQKLQEKHPANL
jgi:drug/metabolite transporter (DMT)-like permease